MSVIFCLLKREYEQLYIEGIPISTNHTSIKIINWFAIYIDLELFVIYIVTNSGIVKYILFTDKFIRINNKIK